MRYRGQEGTPCQESCWDVLRKKGWKPCRTLCPELCLGSIRWYLQGRLRTLVSAVHVTAVKKHRASVIRLPSHHGREDKAVEHTMREDPKQKQWIQSVFPNPHAVQGLWETVLPASHVVLQNLLGKDAAHPALTRKCCLGLEVMIACLHPAALSKPCHWHRSDTDLLRQNSWHFTLHRACSSALYFRAHVQ